MTIRNILVFLYFTASAKILLLVNLHNYSTVLHFFLIYDKFTIQ